MNPTLVASTGFIAWTLVLLAVVSGRSDVTDPPAFAAS